MTLPRSAHHSPYTEFSKLRSGAHYNLATSGVMSYPLAELPITIEDLEINSPDPYGYPPLIERIARHTAAPPECVVTAAGTSFANHLAFAALFDPGDEILIEQPTYEVLLSTASFLGAAIRRFPRRPENNFGIDPDDLRKAITSRTKLIVICNLHNPTSAFLSNDVLLEIGHIAAQHGALVLVDEVYLETIWDNRPGSSFHLGDNFVVTSSMTKAYGLGGLRCGWILAQPQLARKMWRLDDLFSASPVHAGERIAVAAFDHLPAIAARARDIVETNRRVLDDFLRSRSDLQCAIPAFGTTAFPRLLTGPVESFYDLLRTKYDTGVVPGHFFEQPEHFRIGIGGEKKMTEEALDRLARALDSFTS
ncbi:MAG TPA: pyridoxal phosphate-dependent aminotransferase [Clostridia bacterium]|nr:pyridoxal phosphate-dependent aminotransferase [Clostridia bacterium]